MCLSEHDLNRFGGTPLSSHLGYLQVSLPGLGPLKEVCTRMARSERRPMNSDQRLGRKRRAKRYSFDARSDLRGRWEGLSEKRGTNHVPTATSHSPPAKIRCWHFRLSDARSRLRSPGSRPASPRIPLRLAHAPQPIIDGRLRSLFAPIFNQAAFGIHQGAGRSDTRLSLPPSPTQ
jgi:hypothetical protein